MSRSFRIAYLSHTLRSDWNNGNAHFLRGLLDNLRQLGHEVTAWEPATEWSLENLLQESDGQASLDQFAALYPDLRTALYPAAEITDKAAWRTRLEDTDVVILHEWNPPALAHALLALRDEQPAGSGFKLLFHDTHHRASSSPEAIRDFGTDRFDGVLAFGEALRTIYRDRFNIRQVWTLHEAADTRLFHPIPGTPPQQDIVWIGNWGDNERSAEIREFLLTPAAQLPQFSTTIHGVRYPAEGLEALAAAGVRYGGYLPNLEAPNTYAASRLTVHVPRQQYSGSMGGNSAMHGIPTIRVFEALACGIPLISAPWQDTESLFREGDFFWAQNSLEMAATMHRLLRHPDEAAAQAARGRETVLARHTCRHRAEQLTGILEDLLR